MNIRKVKTEFAVIFKETYSDFIKFLIWFSKVILLKTQNEGYQKPGAGGPPKSQGGNMSPPPTTLPYSLYISRSDLDEFSSLLLQMDTKTLTNLKAGGISLLQKVKTTFLQNCIKSSKRLQ